MNKALLLLHDGVGSSRAVLMMTRLNHHHHHHHLPPCVGLARPRVCQVAVKEEFQLVMMSFCENEV